MGFVARAVWNYFRNLMTARGTSSSPATVLGTWWASSSGKSLRSILLRMLPCLICWHIWCSRNKTIFEDSPMNPTSIIRRIRNDVFLAFRGRPFKGNVGSRSRQLEIAFSICSAQYSSRAGIGWAMPGLSFAPLCDSSFCLFLISSLLLPSFHFLAWFTAFLFVYCLCPLIPLPIEITWFTSRTGHAY